MFLFGLTLVSTPCWFASQVTIDIVLSFSLLRSICSGVKTTTLLKYPCSCPLSMTAALLLVDAFFPPSHLLLDSPSSLGLLLSPHLSRPVPATRAIQALKRTIARMTKIKIFWSSPPWMPFYDTYDVTYCLGSSIPFDLLVSTSTTQRIKYWWTNYQCHRLDLRQWLLS